jgi:Transferrin receptor-like dimerisation domain
MILAPSIYDSYGGEGFPALSDALFRAIEEESDENWIEVRKQLSIAIYVVNSASYVLDEPLRFEREF